MSAKRKWLADDPQEIILNVLGYQEDDEWIALALEMDLRGYGATFDEAIKDLIDLVTMQIGFALFKNQPSMIFKPAEPRYFLLYQELRDQRIQSFGQKTDEEDFAIRGVPLPPPSLLAAQFKDRFRQAYG